MPGPHPGPGPRPPHGPINKPTPPPARPIPPPPVRPGHNGGVMPGRPVNPNDPSHVIRHDHPSQQGNPWSAGHFRDSADRYQDIAHRDPNAFRNLAPFRDHWRTEFRDRTMNNGRVYTGYYHNNAYRYYYSGWFPRGFYGGYWYPVRPCYDVQNYFVYPVVFWMFYVDEDQSGYWDGYYPGWNQSRPSPAPSPTPAPIPAPPKAFPFAGVFYPTDTLRDLGMEVSSMSSDLQETFESGLTYFLEDLQDGISNQLTQPITFNQQEVVINHYQNLQDQAIVVEGFVDRDGMHYAFKSLIDLVDPTQTMTFVPNTQDPDPTDDTTLQMINDRIQQLGGDPYSADQEPEH